MNKIVTFFRESMVARFLIPLGIILIVFGSIVFVINKKNSNYIKTDAVVSKVELAEEAYTDVDGNYIDATYHVYVKYTVAGQDYDTELGILSGYKEGEKLNIYYNPENPNEITQTISLILPIVMIVAGIAALIGGVMSGVNAIKKYRRMKVQEEGWKKNE